MAVGEFYAGKELLSRIMQRQLPKGDALMMAEMAGLQGVKLASALMPLCHPLSIELVRLRLLPVEARGAVRVYCEVATEARTGVEMEAMTGAAVAALTIYDMCKGQDKSISVEQLRLVFKSGGKSGVYRTDDGAGA